MKLISDSGNLVELTIEAYEFEAELPQDDDPWDANWLVISGRVLDSGETWTFNDPCLTTWEAKELLQFLRHPDARGGEAIEFTEPSIELQATTTSPDAVTLTVTFRAECSPPTTLEDDRWGKGRTVLLPLTRGALRVASDEWATELENFPER